jgi:hypothetical protein
MSIISLIVLLVPSLKDIVPFNEFNADMVVSVFILGYKSGLVDSVFRVLTVLFPTVFVFKVYLMCLKVSQEFDLIGTG